MTKQRDIVDVLASYIMREQLERVPERLRALAKIHMIDGVGVMLAGAAASQGRALQRGPLRADGPADTSITMADWRLGPSATAFRYAFNARLLDHDDVQTTEYSTYGLLTHPTAPVLASVLALGEARHASGEAVLCAFLTGVEVSARLAECIDPKLLFDRFSATATCGGIGALLAAAKLVGLRKRAVRSALAIWDTVVACDGCATESALNAALRDAQSVRMAVEAVLLAEAGLIVDAPLRRLSFLEAIPPSAFAARLAKPHYILQPGFAIRVYPSNPLGHPAVDLALAIVNLHGLDPDHIQRIEVDVTDVMGKVLLLSTPTSVAERGRNLPFVLALAVCKGFIDADHFRRFPSEQALIDLMGRIVCNIDPELDALGHERARTVVRITIHGGRVIEMKADVAKGSPQKPLSEIELFHKFFKCALHFLDEQHAEQLLNKLWLLEELHDVADLLGKGAPFSGNSHHATTCVDDHLHKHGPSGKRQRRVKAEIRRNMTGPVLGAK